MLIELDTRDGLHVLRIVAEKDDPPKAAQLYLGITGSFRKHGGEYGTTNSFVGITRDTLRSIRTIIDIILEEEHDRTEERHRDEDATSRKTLRKGKRID